MADTVTISLEPEIFERLQRLAEANGERLEDLARDVLEQTVAEFEAADGDDAELQRRIAAWRRDRLGVSGDEVHEWLRRMDADPETPPPLPKRMP